MEEEIFRASAKDRLVKAVGIQLAHELKDLHIYINGVDITKNFVLEEIRIVVETKPPEIGVVLAEQLTPKPSQKAE